MTSERLNVAGGVHRGDLKVLLALALRAYSDEYWESAPRPKVEWRPPPALSSHLLDALEEGGFHLVREGEAVVDGDVWTVERKGSLAGGRIARLHPTGVPDSPHL